METKSLKTAKPDLEPNESLFSEIKALIDSAKQKVAVEVNSTMSALYWEIGSRINQDLLKNERAEYGKQTISLLATQLQAEYGTNSFSEKNLRRMMQFASVFPERAIVATLLRQFSWSHFTLFIPIQAVEAAKNRLEQNAERSRSTK